MHGIVLCRMREQPDRGRRAFCSDESGVIKVDPSGSVRRCLENGGDLR
jgi:hypothetical protein